MSADAHSVVLSRLAQRLVAEDRLVEAGAVLAAAFAAHRAGR